MASLRWGEVDDVNLIGQDFDLVLTSDVVYHDPFNIFFKKKNLKDFSYFLLILNLFLFKKKTLQNALFDKNLKVKGLN